MKMRASEDRRFCCMLTVTVIVLLAVGSGAKATEEEKKGYSPVLSRFLYTVNGNYTAEVETSDVDGNTVVSYDHVSLIPVNTPPSRDAVEFLYIGVSNDPVINSHFLYTVADGAIDGTLKLEMYSLPMDDILRSHKSANGVLTLPSNAKIEHMSSCPMWFIEQEIGLFNAFWTDCLLRVERVYPALYLDNFMCDSTDVTIVEGDSKIVRHFVRHGERYPLMPETEEMMKGTKNPCEDH